MGASKQISLLLKSAAEVELIKWHFNPTHAPSFGGLWEFGTKAVKTHLSIGYQFRSFEELYTVLVQITDYFKISDLGHAKVSHLSRWQLVQRLRQDFWRRWR